jgi:hypothetical protein
MTEPDEVPESWNSLPDELDAADQADREADTERRLGEEYGSTPWPTGPGETWPDTGWPTPPEDRSGDPSRRPEDVLSDLGMPNMMDYYTEMRKKDFKARLKDQHKPINKDD